MKKSRRAHKSKTRAFGSPARVCHDSAAFYSGRMCRGLPKEEKVEPIENLVPERFLDRILCQSSERMTELPDCSAHLMVTSPPYNVGKDYDRDLTLGEYRAFLKRVWREVFRVLVPGGRAAINIANLGRKPYLPLHIYLVEDMIELGFLMRGEIIWNKGASASPSTAWGSWLSPSNPTLRDVHEYVLVFSKQSYTRKNFMKRKKTITKNEFTEFTKSVWNFPATPAKKIGHPAPFPVELPYRLIQLYTFERELVLDPFIGSGQTAIAALKSGRKYVGYEINQDYVRLAKANIAGFLKENEKSHHSRL